MLIRSVSVSKAVLPGRKRRGVTAMEYLFMVSLIVVGVILAVQHIGSLTAGKLKDAANKSAPAAP